MQPGFIKKIKKHKNKNEGSWTFSNLNLFLQAMPINFEMMTLCSLVN